MEFQLKDITFCSFSFEWSSWQCASSVIPILLNLVTNIPTTCCECMLMIIAQCRLQITCGNESCLVQHVGNPELRVGLATFHHAFHCFIAILSHVLKPSSFLSFPLRFSEKWMFLIRGKVHCFKLCCRSTYGKNKQKRNETEWTVPQIR